MSDQETIERIQQEVHTANKAKLYERKKLLINTPEESPMQVDENGDTIRQMLGDTKTKPEYTSAEVKSKHHNWLLDNSGKHMKDFFKEIEKHGEDWTLKEFTEKLNKQMKVIFNTKEKK